MLNFIVCHVKIKRSYYSLRKELHLVTVIVHLDEIEQSRAPKAIHHDAKGLPNRRKSLILFLTSMIIYINKESENNENAISIQQLIS